MARLYFFYFGRRLVWNLISSHIHSFIQRQEKPQKTRRWNFVRFSLINKLNFIVLGFLFIKKNRHHFFFFFLALHFLIKEILISDVIKNEFVFCSNIQTMKISTKTSISIEGMSKSNTRLRTVEHRSYPFFILNSSY